MKYETNSRLVKKGQIFVAIKGYTVDGHDYIEDAILNGASKIITTKDVDIKVPYLKVENSEEYLKEQLKKEYADEFKDLKLIALTGTNGKTTTAFLAYQMLIKLNKKVSYIGTIGFYNDNKHRELPNTTPDILTLYKLLFEAKEANAEFIIMEVSSHALYLERIAGLKFDVAGFTNLSQDHLDFHKTMEKYLEAKLKIINYLKKEATLIVNGDDPASNLFNFKNKLTLGKNGDIKILDYKFKTNQTHLKFMFNNKKEEITTNLINEFNIYNYLMALAIVTSLNIDLLDVIKVTKEVYAPKGRSETVAVKKGHAVIDYAHTPDAVLKIITAYKKLNHGKIITLLGCGGDRDPKKRPIMGNIATTYSDYVIFTSDNPRTEDPTKIINDIIKDNKSSNYKVIVDREEAIKEGICLLKENDYLLILGKGHENYQIIGREKIPFSDYEIVKNYDKIN